jgi:hypothetical protein
MAKRQSSLEGAKRAPRTGRAADFTRLAVGVTRARRLSASQVATATLLGQFVEAAYAMFQANPGDPTPPPSPNFPAGYNLVAGIEMRDFIIGSTEHLFYGFIAQSTTAANQFVAAFRGTVGGVEWWDDFNSIVLTPFRVPGCGSVGAGFARIYNTIALVAYPSAAAPNTPLAERSLSSRGSLSRQVAALVSRHGPAAPEGKAAAPPVSISVTGHSLGSALACLYVLENAKTNKLPTPSVCTFASPRVGDRAFVTAFNGLNLTSSRFAIDQDLVPQLPPEPFGFRHVNTLRTLNATGKVQPNFSCWHALTSYLSLVDPSLPPAPACAIGTAVAARPLGLPGGVLDLSLNTGLD